MKDSQFFQLNERIQNLLIQKGFRNLKPIQEKSTKAIFDNKNVLIVAPTASGKTESAFIPVISKILDDTSDELSLKCIFVAPLKALLNDIERRLISLKESEDSSPYLFKWHGDVNRYQKLKALKFEPDILLTTPESLEVIFVSSKINHIEFFKHVRYIIIDEIHYFAASNRGSQLNSLISRVQNVSLNEIQRIGLSATIENPEQIIEWMCYGSDLEKELIKSSEVRKTPELKLFYDEKFENTTQELLHSLCKNSKAIIFSNSKTDTEKIAQDLQKVNIDVEVHHGSISKYIREEAEEKIKQNERGVISATSTLELGIDIGDLSKVIQYENLPSINSFLQRLGRSGRRTGSNPHIACISYNGEQLLLNLAIISLGLIDNYCEPIKPSSIRYDILFQQLLSEAVASYGIRVDEFRKKINRSYSFKDITSNEIDELIEFWVNENLIRKDNDFILLGVKGEKNFTYKNYMELFSVFYSNDEYEVLNNKNSIGVLDSDFVNRMTPEFLFRLAGRKWMVEEIKHNVKHIYVSEASGGSIPRWSGFGGHNFDYRIAQRVREIVAFEFDLSPLNLTEDFSQPIEELGAGEKYLKMLNDEIRIISFNKKTILFTYAGSQFNSLISLLIDQFEDLDCNKFDFVFIEYKKSDLFSKLRSGIEKIKNLSSSELKNILMNKIEVDYDSKYAKYLPDKFLRKYIIERDFNPEEFLNYIRKSKVV